MRASLWMCLCLLVAGHASANTTTAVAVSTNTTAANTSNITYPLVFFTLQTQMPLYPVDYVTLEQYRNVISMLTLVKLETITIDVGTISLDEPVIHPGITLSFHVIFRVETWGAAVGLMNTILSDDFQFLLDYYCFYVPLPAATVVRESVHYLNTGPPAVADVGNSNTTTKAASSAGSKYSRRSGVLALAVVVMSTLVAM